MARIKVGYYQNRPAGVQLWLPTQHEFLLHTGYAFKGIVPVRSITNKVETERGDYSILEDHPIDGHLLLIDLFEGQGYGYIELVTKLLGEELTNNLMALYADKQGYVMFHDEIHQIEKIDDAQLSKTLDKIAIRA